MPDDPPRRSSIYNEQDRVKNAWLLSTGRRLSVMLNGVEVPKVTAFDADKGWVQAHAIDDKGQIIYGNGQIETVVIEGEVTVAIVPKVPEEVKP